MRDSENRRGGVRRWRDVGLKATRSDDGPRIRAPRRPAEASAYSVVLLIVAIVSLGCWPVGPVVCLIANDAVKSRQGAGRPADPALVTARALGAIATVYLAGVLALLLFGVAVSVLHAFR